MRTAGVEKAPAEVSGTYVFSVMAAAAAMIRAATTATTKARMVLLPEFPDF